MQANVSQCKTQAARLFRAGDYASARAVYQRGIDSLNTDQGHVRTWKATCNTVAELHANIAARERVHNRVWGPEAR